MSFTFTPVSEESIQLGGLLPKGTYPFKVMRAEQKVSRSGNNMIELMLKLWDETGKEYLVYDYLLAGEAGAYKLRHFCYGTGLEEKYEQGAFDVYDCEHRQGQARIVIREDKTGNYPPKNTVQDYLAPLKSNDDTPFSDDIPF